MKEKTKVQENLLEEEFLDPLKLKKFEQHVLDNTIDWPLDENGLVAMTDEEWDKW